MSKPNFSSVLDKPATEIARPKPLPVGTYLAVVEGLPRYDKSSKKQTDFVEFSMRITAAADDVDEAELQEVGLTLKDGTSRTMKNTYYLTEDAAWRLKKFLEDLGFDFSGDLTMREACESAANREVYLTITHEPSQDGQSIFARIGGTASVE